MPRNDGSPTLSVNPLTFSKRLLIIAVILLLLNLCAIYLKKVLLIDNFVSNALYFFFNASAEALHARMAPSIETSIKASGNGEDQRRNSSGVMRLLS